MTWAVSSTRKYLKTNFKSNRHLKLITNIDLLHIQFKVMKLIVNNIIILIAFSNSNCIVNNSNELDFFKGLVIYVIIHMN